MATQGLLKTAISVASNEVKDNFTKGIKEGLSEYIAKDLLDIDNKGNDEQRKKDIKLASDLSAGVSIDMLIGGAYSIVKGSKNAVKADEKLKESNVNSNTNIKIDINKQNKHIQGTNEFKTANQSGISRSILTENIEDLLPKLGTGQQVNNIRIGLAGSKERIDFGKVIGYYIDEAGNKLPTTKGIVHYSKNGTHIVPAKPN